MCLLITLFAAIISTVVWYVHAENDTYKTSVLMLIFWGASLMWLIDAVFEYAELGIEFFNQSSSELLNDFVLGLCVAALGLIAWILYLLIKDPKQILKNKLYKK